MNLKLNYMKKILTICILILLGAGCSIEGIQDPIIIQGIDGKDGVDGIDGINGTSSTIEIVEEDAGYWLIFLEDGVEVKRIFNRYAVDGTNGTDGEDGKDGYDTRMNFLDITAEMESVCEEGIRVQYGLDLDRNGELEADEVEGFTDVCKCVCNECEYDIPYYDVELICCDDYEGKSVTVCQITGIKVTKGIIGKPELETTEILCF